MHAVPANVSEGIVDYIHFRRINIRYIKSPSVGSPRRIITDQLVIPLCIYSFDTAAQSGKKRKDQSSHKPQQSSFPRSFFLQHLSVYLPGLMRSTHNPVQVEETAAAVRLEW
ncbi:hypothetical protein D3C73_1433700 [compost metagenome]